MANGFVSGLAAPAAAFHIDPPPPIPERRMLEMPDIPLAPVDAAWAAVGNDLRAVIENEQARQIRKNRS